MLRRESLNIRHSFAALVVVKLDHLIYYTQIAILHDFDYVADISWYFKLWINRTVFGHEISVYPMNHEHIVCGVCQVGCTADITFAKEGFSLSRMTDEMNVDVEFLSPL